MGKVVWLVNPYGNIPGEGWSDYRFNMLAKALVERGFMVRWWVAGFEHRSKVFRTTEFKNLSIEANYQISIIPVPGYSKHISLKRIFFERSFAKGVLKYSELLNDSPELIIFAEPALFVEDIYRIIARKVKAKYVVDIIDIWPELFRQVLPNSLKKLEKAIFFPLYYRRKRFIRKASGIIAVSRDYLEIGKKINPRAPSQVVYWGINVEKLDLSIIPDEIKKFCESKSGNGFWLVYAGTLGENYDIKGILGLALRLKDDLRISIVIAGDGPLKEFIFDFIKTNVLNNVFYLGRLNHSSLAYIYNFCDIAISSYIKESTVSMPIKAYDYFKFGLPILNSLGRDLGHYVIACNCGVNYEAENTHDMHDKVRYLISNRNRLTNMGTNGKLLSESFDASKQYGKAGEWFYHFVTDNRD